MRSTTMRTLLAHGLLSVVLVGCSAGAARSEPTRSSLNLDCCTPPVDTTWPVSLSVQTLPPLTPTEPASSAAAVVVTEPDLDGVMPDVLCMDLQDAQDLIQTRGVFFSRSEDASGEGRRQIIDSNWIVVAQTPAAGEPIDEGDAVLSVLKDEEVSECTPGVGGS